jgi:hypothetical protein
MCFIVLFSLDLRNVLIASANEAQCVDGGYWDCGARTSAYHDFRLSSPFAGNHTRR